MNAYKGFTEAQAKAHKKYMEGVATIQIRTDAERRETIRNHAASNGESLNQFVNRAIDETMERDKISAASAAADPGERSEGVPVGES